jgi:peptidyl-prolyl cis-trans isomerase B (cyclophilin B)
VASTRREKELARLRAERQAARRAEAAARRKRRNAMVASALAVLLVVGAVAFLTTRGGDDDTTAAPPSPSAPAGTCTYTPEGEASKPVEPPPAEPTATGPVNATMTTDQGVVTFSLDTTKAPCTSNSFISLAAQKFYDGTKCHRLTTGGLNVLQCGDPTASGSGGPGYAYADENLEGATYPAGTVAMANSGPGTNGSQFFLVYQDSELQPNYTPVGRITSGLDVLTKVAAAGSEPAEDGEPKLPVNITTFTTDAAPVAPVPSEPVAPVPAPSASATP